MKYALDSLHMTVTLAPAAIAHGLAHAKAALSFGRPVTLLSAPGAGLAGGAGWWQAVIRAARAAYPATPCQDILDCADAPGMAMAALRLQQRLLVLSESTPGFAAVARAAAIQGALVLPRAPEGLNLALRSHFYRLGEHLDPTGRQIITKLDRDSIQTLR
jgi:hypothetical protein